MDEQTYTQVMLTIAQFFEMVAALILVIGLVLSLALAVNRWRRAHETAAAYRLLRQGFGGVLLLSLEILVAGDLIRTVAIAPTIENVTVLGLIVLIRTFLSFSLEIEIEGVPPWRKAFVSGAAVVRQAVRETSSP